jgi:F0F1-type ATP synthase assembly protein I
MAKQIVAVLVSALILFLWQFLSWSILGVHQSEFKYTPNQDKILAALSEHLSEAGVYMIPGVPPGSSFEQEQALMESHAGQPWASVNYRKSYNPAMGMNLVRGFVADVLAAFFLVWLLMRLQQRNFRNILLGALSVGLIGYLTIPYLNSIWFETNSMGYLLDAAAQWGLVGLWLGWWLPRL